MRRDRSPIPPPREPKRDAMWMRERERDMMDRRPPPPRGRRTPSPPPYKRHRRDDYYDERHERYSPRGRGRSPDYGGRFPEEYDPYYGGPPGHHQPPPPPRREAERRGGGPGGARGGAPPSSGPLSFKQFLVTEVPDDVNPTQAQDMYDQYLTRHFGNQLRAKFEQEKGQKDVHAAFHPSAFEASLARHQEGAAQAAAQLAADIQDGRYEPSAPTFNQGLLDGDEGDGEAAKERAAAPEGPVCLWKPARAAQDYRVAKKLVATVDHQRGLKLSDNPLLPQDVIASAGAYGAQEGEGKDTDMEGGEAKAAADGEEGAAGSGSGGEGEAVLRAVLAAADAEEVLCEEDSALLDRLGQLDLLLTWLWRVHGIDYYGGRELLLEADYDARDSKQRTVRGPRPEEGEEQDEEEAKVDAAALAARVDDVWTARLTQPDPLVQGCQRDEIQKRLDDWMESCVKQESEKKWGSSFSNKYFLEKRFVVKHILNKHQDKLDAHKDVIRDELYWERYEAAKLAARDAQRKVAKQREEAAAAAAAAAAGGEGEWQEGMEVDEMRGGAGGRGPMRGRGRGPMPGGRGRGMPPGPGGMLGDMPILDPAQMMMMGGLPGPIILPGPGMMPGALPLGGPMMFDPAMMGGDMGGLPIIIPQQGGGRGMGGRMMRGRGGRGMGGRGMAPPGTKLEGPGYLKHYYDLDAPQNNRAVLDYGDL